jgi:hypothetical protein
MDNPIREQEEQVRDFVISNPVLLEDINPIPKQKKIKHYECQKCKKTYCSMGWCLFYKKKIGHVKFKEINRELKSYEITRKNKERN